MSMAGTSRVPSLATRRVRFQRLTCFQAFDSIAAYYDNGRDAVSTALHVALDFVLAKNVADYRHANPNARRLLQVSDYVCTVLCVSEGCDAGRKPKTHERFSAIAGASFNHSKSSGLERCLCRLFPDAPAATRSSCLMFERDSAPAGACPGPFSSAVNTLSSDQNW